MDASLARAVEQVYAAFAGERPDTLADACPCCVEPEEVRALLATSLRELTAAALERYAGKAMTTWGTAGDYRHFLPRILELVALGQADGSHGLSWLVIAGRLSLAGGERPWSASESAALRGYFAASWQAALTGAAQADVDAEFLAAAQAVGVDVPALLAALRSPLDVHAAGLLAAIAGDLLSRLEGGQRVDALLRAWLFAEATAALVDEALLEFPEAAAGLDGVYETWRACAATL